MFVLWDTNIRHRLPSPSEVISVDAITASPIHQRVQSKKLEDHQFSLLMKASSPADKARLLSVSAPHAFVEHLKQKIALSAEAKAVYLDEESEDYIKDVIASPESAEYLETLPTESFQQLPSQRTLRDYTHYISSSSGFSTDVDKMLMDAARITTCPEREKYVILLLDEMHVRDDLVYDKHSGKMIGFANLGEVNNHLSQYEQSLQGDTAGGPQVAKTVVFDGMCAKWDDIVSVYRADNATGWGVQLIPKPYQSNILFKNACRFGCPDNDGIFMQTIKTLQADSAFSLTSENAALQIAAKLSVWIPLHLSQVDAFEQKTAKHQLCCSDYVAPLDLSSPIAEQLTALEQEGVEVYDAFLQQMVLVMAPLICIVCDNPRASELLIAKTEMRKQYGLREIENPLFSIPADLFRYMPVEVLHTKLLDTCLTTSDTVQEFKAVNLGEFIELVTPYDQMQYGLLLATFNTTSGTTHCLVQGFHSCKSTDGFCGCNGAATDINDRAPPRTTYINIADDEYAEQDFGVEDAADNDEYADKDFENLVKQFRVDEKMCYYPFPKCGINVPSLTTVRAFIVLGVDMPQRHLSTDGNPYYSLSLTSIIRNCLQTPEISSCLARFPVRTAGDYTKCWNENPRFATLMVSLPHGREIFVRNWVYFHHNDIGMTKGVILSFFKQDASTCTTALVIAPLILIICDNPRASELLGHLGSTALKYCRICMADKNDSPNIVCEQRNLMQAQCRLCKLNLNGANGDGNSTLFKLPQIMVRPSGSSTTVKSIDLEHCVLYVATPKQLFDFMAVNPAISLPSLHPMN
ncbi:hypothetical protein EMCRGX_G027357 [Ephydatia muelleri]